jgi:hypothetical protein
METVDRTAMCRALYPVLRDLASRGADEHTLRNAVAASAEGYAFPTNLDRDQPIGGLAPQSQADLLRQAVAESWTPDQLDQALTEGNNRRQTH